MRNALLRSLTEQLREPRFLAVRGDGKQTLETKGNSLDSSTIGLSHLALPLSVTRSNLLVILSVAVSLVTGPLVTVLQRLPKFAG